MTGSGERDDRRRWTVAIFWFVGLQGLLLQSRGALLSSFQSTFGVSEAQLGLISAVGAMAFLGPILLLGMNAGRIDMGRAFLVGTAGAALAALATGFAPTFLLLLGLVAARMAAEGTVRSIDRPILGHLYTAERGRIFNLHVMVWAVGATAGPLVVNLALDVGDWRLTYLLAGVLLVPVAVFASRLDLPASVENERSLDAADLRAILAHPTVRVMGVALILIVCVEAALFTWLPYYASQFLPRASANLLLSTYLVAYVPGRYAFSEALDRRSGLRLVAWSGPLALAFAGVAFATSRPPAVLFAAVFGLGFLVSGVFPTLLGWGADAVPEHTGPINAIAMTASQTGFFVAPAAVGLLADRYGIVAAMQLPVVLLAAFVLVAGGVLVLRRVRP